MALKIIYLHCISQERVPNGYEYYCCWGVGSCYQIFKPKNSSVSQPIVIKLWLLIGDSIRYFCTVLDFKVKPN